MFKRVFLEDWVATASVISFALILGVFVIATIRALRLSRSEREHLASLPLDDAPPAAKNDPETTSSPTPPSNDSKP